MTIARRAYGKLIVHFREMGSECALTTHKNEVSRSGDMPVPRHFTFFLSFRLYDAGRGLLSGGGSQPDGVVRVDVEEVRMPTLDFRADEKFAA